MFRLLIIFGIIFNIVSFFYTGFSFFILIFNLSFLVILYLYREKRVSDSLKENNTDIIKDDSISNYELQEFFLSQLREIIIVTNKFNVVTYANEAANIFFGKSLLAQNISSELRIPELLDSIDQVRELEKIINIDIELKVPVYKFLKVDVIPAKQQNIIIIIRDHTEIKKSQDLRSDFVANVSHELKTPLSSIRGFLETITTSAKDDPKMQKKFIEIMQQQAEKMQILIDDLMTLSRIEQQEHIKPKNNIILNNVILEAINNYKDTKNRISIKFNIPSKNILIKGDKEKLLVAFKNILDNAIKYGANKSITVNLESFDSKISLSIIDQGIGISQKDILRITERFYRSDNAKKLKIDGTGIGLSIVKHIINQHGAELKIHSIEGKGSNFTIEFAQL